MQDIFKIKSSNYNTRNAEAAAQKCTVKKVFLKISQNSHENSCARVSFLIKLHRFL